MTCDCKRVENAQKERNMRRYVGLVIVLVLGSCAEMMGTTAGSSRPTVPKDLAPVDVKFAHLLNAEFGKSYVGKRVRTNAGLYQMFDSMMGMDAKYQSGWVRAIMLAASPTAEKTDCDWSKVATLGLSIVAPTPVGVAWADAKSGTAYEIIGVVYEAESSSAISGASAANLILEVESLKVIGQCPEAPGLGGAK